MVSSRAAIGVACAALLGTSAAATVGCVGLLPPQRLQLSAPRAILPTDLIDLRDIGWSGAEDAPLSLSPDGSRVAFQLRKADTSTNGYCLGMVVVSLGEPHSAQIVDGGGEIIFAKTPVDGGLADRPVGVPDVIAPKWSADGLWIAFRRRDRGVTQLWRARSDGTLSEALTYGSVDVDDFAWLADGRRLLFETHPGLSAAQKQIEVEGATGFHLDDRSFPNIGTLPLAVDRSDPKFGVVDTMTHDVRAASEVDRRVLLPRPDPSKPEAAALFADGGAGRHAWTSPVDVRRPFADQILSVATPDQEQSTCGASVCEGHFSGLWWPARRSALYFLKRSGEADSGYSLFRWLPGAAQPQAIFTTNDLIAGCMLARSRLVCTDEGSTAPRRIVSIDLDRPRLSPVFEPNPEFAQIRLGSVRRLTWKNDLGLPTFGDLVLPPGDNPGKRLPLIVVQYGSRGFLRGGSGDEYPIQLFASAGFAVLSFQRPIDVGVLSPAKTGPELYRGDLKNFADRRSVLSSIETGIRLLVDQGVVDPGRVGLTGLSDGASTVQFALLHSQAFAAVAMSSCCEDVDSLALTGPVIARYFETAGAPLPGDGADSYWSQYSLSRNASNVDVPILLQSADREMLNAYLPLAALTAHGKHVDAFVYPDEFHIKWQPAHRLAVYDRNLLWFDFWLKTGGADLPRPNDAEQWHAWETLSAKPLPVTH